MKRLLNNKNIIIAIVLIGFVFLLTGCNKQIFDTEYTFDYAECYLNGEYIRYDIKKWKDYDGEQIQITTKDGYVYVVSMNYCRLIKEP